MPTTISPWRTPDLTIGLPPLIARSGGKRGEIWWADLGAYRAREETGRRPVVVWQSGTLTRLLQSVLVVPFTTNLDRAKLTGTALISASDCALTADEDRFAAGGVRARNANRPKAPGAFA